MLCGLAGAGQACGFGALGVFTCCVGPGLFCADCLGPRCLGLCRFGARGRFGGSLPLRLCPGRRIGGEALLRRDVHRRRRLRRRCMACRLRCAGGQRWRSRRRGGCHRQGRQVRDAGCHGDHGRCGCRIGRWWRQGHRHWRCIGYRPSPGRSGCRGRCCPGGFRHRRHGRVGRPGRGGRDGCNCRSLGRRCWRCWQDIGHRGWRIGDWQGRRRLHGGRCASPWCQGLDLGSRRRHSCGHSLHWRRGRWERRTWRGGCRWHCVRWCCRLRQHHDPQVRHRATPLLPGQAEARRAAAVAIDHQAHQQGVQQQRHAHRPVQTPTVRMQQPGARGPCGHSQGRQAQALASTRLAGR